jgi:hypothetical protein
MLLSSFVEMELGPADFARLLARYAADPRPDIAEAAGVLQCAWERTTVATSPAPLPLRQQLGLLGSLLDEAGAFAAYLSVGAAGALIQGCGPAPFERTLAPGELQHEHARRRAGGSEEAVIARAIPDRFTTRLHLVGALLEQQAAAAYELYCGPHCVEVESSDGSCQVFTPAELTQGLPVMRQ